jgi:hypothetical protein
LRSDWKGDQVRRGGRGQLFNRREMLRASIATTLAGAAGASGAGLLFAGRPTSLHAAPINASNNMAVTRWNNAALEAIRVSKLGPPMVARALAVTHVCMYDAWTSFDPRAIPARANGIPKLPNHRGVPMRAQAISFAAYRALLDLFPSQSALFVDLMYRLGYDPADASTDTSTPTGIGNLAAQVVIDFCHGDGSNQLNGYKDYTGYPGGYADYPAAPLPVNTADTINDPNHWQPLRVPWGSSNVQTYLGPHWGLVTPFALTPGHLSPNPGAQFRSTAGPKTTPFGPGTTPDPGYVTQAQQILAYSAGLTDTQKVIVEYWRDGPSSETPPGHWNLFAQFVSRRDGHRLDEDVKLFFALNGALLDASIAAWDAKRYFNSVRPITAIHYLYAGQPVTAWGGPCRGTQVIDGAMWMPYQPATLITPPFPEFFSGHSTFSAAGAEILRRFTGSDTFGGWYTAAPGSSAVERCTPATPITLSWDTFSAAADQAGISRRYGGIHFADADLAGRSLGRRIGAQAWDRAQAYIAGERQQTSPNDLRRVAIKFVTEFPAP